MTESTYITPPPEDQEIWKPVVGWEQYYEVSTLGRVKSLRRNKILNSRRNKGGYRTVSFWKGHYQKLNRVHSVMLETFVGPRPTGWVINHKNGIRYDNRLENLEYISWQGNIDHGVELGHFCKKLTPLDVMEIKRLLTAPNVNMTHIGNQFGVTVQMIYNIREEKSWKRIKLDSSPSSIVNFPEHSY